MTVEDHRKRSLAVRLVASALTYALLGAVASHAEPRHGIAMHGAPKHPADMTAFPYVNQTAPKGGRLSLGIQGTFDSLNPLIPKGESASGVRGYVYESLMARADDEPFSLYGLIAESVDVPDDRRSITFALRKEARFSDGQPVKVADVIFTHALLKEKGWPFQRSSYGKVQVIETPGERQVRFVFKPEADGSVDREMPLIMGLMPILPAHAINRDTFEQTTLEPPIGSGPYRVGRIEAGRILTFQRNPDWWARDLAVARGRYNFDEIRHEYFRDQTVMFEAFKTGEIDVFADSDPGRWSSGYDFPALAEGRVVKREFATRLPAGMSALVFNTRRPPFTDKRVRDALTLLFDFDWINRNLYGGLYKRTQSFFERSTLSSFGKSADARERDLLKPFPDAVTPAILDGTATLPATDGSGNNRVNQHAAVALLAQAGYRLDGRRMMHAASGKQLAFEMLATNRGQERLLLTFSRALEAMGVSMTLRIADSAQYEARLKDGTFDIIQTHWAASLSPGNEQLGRFGSASADQIASRNYAGVKSPAVDAMIAALLAARGHEDFTAAVRAYDRVLRSGSYVIPLFHLPKTWVALRTYLQGPDGETNSGFDLDTWWRKAE